jgi:hypothetical protein
MSPYSYFTPLTVAGCLLATLQGRRWRALIGALGIAFVTSAHAQTDHLQCFKVRDSAHKARYKTGVGGLAPAQGCIIRVPAKLMCVPTEQPETSPSPPGAPAGANAGAFLCYAMRCRRNTLAAVKVADEFGQRIVRPRPSRLFCAPLPAFTEGMEPPTTTTTLTFTTTTTLSGGPTTTTTTRTRTTHTTTRTTSTRPSTTIVGSTTTHPTTTVSTTMTLPGAHCSVANTSCGSCGNGACQTLRPGGQLICAFQECQGTCQSTADCSGGRYCVGTSNLGLCCAPCS